VKAGFLMAALLALAAAPPPAAPSAAPSAPALELTLAGHWTGTLGYRDYQSNTLFRLKVNTEIRAIGDGVTLVRISEFDEGPGRTPAFITSASLYDPAASTVTTAGLRKGRAVEAATEALRVAAYTDATHWTVIAETDGEDDNKPARLRVTEVRDGDKLTATKEVMPVGAAVWAFRNVTELVRVGD